MKNIINIGIPSKGRLRKDVLNIFKKKKLKLVSERGERDLIGSIKNKSNIKILYLHAREIIQRLGDGSLDIGFSGFDLLKEEEINIPASKTEEYFYNNLINDLTEFSEEDVDYTSLDGISTTRRIQYGAAQEPTIAGSTYRLLKAGVQATFSDETFKESAQRIEKDRQEKILEEFPEFRGKKEDLTVLSGRMGVAIADPVTFFIPWVKIAKAGRLAQVSAGAAVAGTDVALREKALYGEVSAGNVGLGVLLGGGSTQLGNVIASRIGINKQTDKLVTVDLSLIHI